MRWNASSTELDDRSVMDLLDDNIVEFALYVGETKQAIENKPTS
jgi:hypothetical protein